MYNQIKKTKINLKLKWLP